MNLRQTHTFVVLDVPKDVYDYIAARLKKASYGHAFDEAGNIDMHGLALVCDPELQSAEFHVKPADHVAVDDNVSYRPMRHPDGSPYCPRGVTVQLLTPGRTNTKGTWDGKDGWWCGWCPLPHIPDGLIPDVVYPTEAQIEAGWPEEWRSRIRIAEQENERARAQSQTPLDASE